ncbi:MAG: phenylalanine--tRNA ligase subunit beta [Saprospiraceae bacterium]|nr:phenylalanine--tRNA ligase subunit beta [Saprospiraceae bacterium]
MRISLNWLRRYIDIGENPQELADILTSLGLEVEGIEQTGVLPEHLEGVVVAEVLECWKHPNADRLRLTRVNAGGGSILQVVCGAPNVEAGQKVLLAKEGATLYPFGGAKPIAISRGKIRGEISEGMLCAEDELGLGPSHEGILVLDPSATVGTPAAEHLDVACDTIFEIGLTPNRADATSHLGVAKDLLAWYRIHRDKNKILLPVDHLKLGSVTGSIQIEVLVEQNERCPRYTGMCFSGIEVGPSPEWLQLCLRAMGLQPVNNVVDVTNFVMYEMGQPLHAFDFDAIAGQRIRVMNLPEGSPFTGLDGITRELKASDLMICDGNGSPLCMAGVFGGLHSGVSTSTRRIFVESAHFQASSVRRSSMGHQLRTQSARCFEKGADPNICLLALERAAFLLQSTARAVPDSPVVDLYPHPVLPAVVRFNGQRAIRLSGLDLDHDQAKEVLLALDMEVRDLQDGNLEVHVPTNKPDVLREADLVEEISRIYGLDHIIDPGTIRFALPQAGDPNWMVKRSLADWLSANGLMEIMSLSMVRSAGCIRAGWALEEELVFVHNTSNVQLDALKPSVCMGGLEALQFNANRQQGDLAFYEVARQYRRKGQEIEEEEMLGIWLCGLREAPHWTAPKGLPNDFYRLKAVMSSIPGKLGLGVPAFEPIQHDPLFSFGLRWVSDGTTVLRFGKLAAKIADCFDLRREIWYGEARLESLMAMRSETVRPFVEFGKHPFVKRDLALVLDAGTPFDRIREIAAEKLGILLVDLQLFDLYENEDQLGKGKQSYAINLTLSQAEGALTSESLESLMDELMAEYTRRLGAYIRR